MRGPLGSPARMDSCLSVEGWEPWGRGLALTGHLLLPFWRRPWAWSVGGKAALLPTGTRPPRPTTTLRSPVLQGRRGVGQASVWPRGKAGVTVLWVWTATPGQGAQGAGLGKPSPGQTPGVGRAAGRQQREAHGQAGRAGAGKATNGKTQAPSMVPARETRQVKNTPHFIFSISSWSS